MSINRKNEKLKLNLQYVVQEWYERQKLISDSSLLHVIAISMLFHPVNTTKIEIIYALKITERENCIYFSTDEGFLLEN